MRTRLEQRPALSIDAAILQQFHPPTAAKSSQPHVAGCYEPSGASLRSVSARTCLRRSTVANKRTRCSTDTTGSSVKPSAMVPLEGSSSRRRGLLPSLSKSYTTCVHTCPSPACDVLQDKLHRVNTCSRTDAIANQRATSYNIRLSSAMLQGKSQER